MIPNRKAERLHWNDGCRLVAGVDEVGRGALAGPVVAAAVILPQRCSLAMVRDSKLMTSQSRGIAAVFIKRQAVAIGIGWAQSKEIDQNGLTWAVGAAGKRALDDAGLLLGRHLRLKGETSTKTITAGDDVQNNNQIEAVILDGNHNYLSGDYKTHTIIKADQSCLCVAAASVIAKVARDDYMKILARTYPDYGFDSHKGYGTAAHWRALEKAQTPVHRRLFLRKYEALRVN